MFWIIVWKWDLIFASSMGPQPLTSYNGWPDPSGKFNIDVCKKLADSAQWRVYDNLVRISNACIKQIAFQVLLANAYAKSWLDRGDIRKFIANLINSWRLSLELGRSLSAKRSFALSTTLWYSSFNSSSDSRTYFLIWNHLRICSPNCIH